MSLVPESVVPLSSANRELINFNEASFKKDSAVGRGGGRKRVKLHIERELRYVMSLKRLSGIVDFSDVSRRLIVQNYFSKKDLARTLRILCALGGFEYQKAMMSRFPKVRLRRMNKPGHSTRYYLEAKGPKRGPKQNKVEREEIPIRISRALYFKLLPRANAGYNKKVRCIVKGEVLGQHGKIHPVRVQVDLWLDAGVCQSRLKNPSRTLDVVTLDLELPKRSLIRSIRCGDHSMIFLHDAHELTWRVKREHQALANSRLAEKGFDKAAVKAIRHALRDVV